jgi:hypothetical protein
MKNSYKNLKNSHLRENLARIIAGMSIIITLLLFNSNVWGQCEIQVRVWDSDYGDEVSWELRNSSNTVVLFGGSYGNGYDDIQTHIETNSPYSFYIESYGSFGDNTPSYEIQVDGSVLFSGSLAGNSQWTSPEINCGEQCDYSVPYTGNNSINASNGYICDHAGWGTNYNNNADGYTVINPASENLMVKISFTHFELDGCCDYVRVYDGSGIGGTELWSGSGTNLPPDITSTTGPLTIYFSSDGSNSYQGFRARISNIVNFVTWTGNISTAWDEPSNWEPNAIPDDKIIAFIPSQNDYTNPPIVNLPKSNPAECQDLIVSEDSEFTIDAGKALTVHNELDNRGIFNIKSNPSGDGSLLARNIIGNGTYNVDRFLLNDMWHMVSSPLTFAQAGVYMYMWLRPYDETSNNFGECIYSFGTTMPPGKGYSAWTFQDDEIVTYSGRINSDPVTVTLQRSPDGGAPLSQGWNLIGNPFPSAINLNTASGWSTNNVGSAVYVWDGNLAGGQYRVTLAGGFGTNPYGISVNSPNQYISMSQGFFVQAITDGATITMNKRAQVHNDVPFRDYQEVPNLIRLKVEGAQGTDETVIYYAQDAADSYDYHYDAAKLYGSENAPQLYTQKQESKLAIHSLNNPDMLAGKIVHFETGTGNNYTITYTHTLVENSNILLRDIITNSLIYPDTDYEFTAENSDETARFEFVFGVTSVDNNQHSNVVLYPNPSRDFVNLEFDVNKSGEMQISVFDVVGREVIKLDKQAFAEGKNLIVIPVSNLSEGYYSVRLTNPESKDEYTNLKFIVK